MGWKQYTVIVVVVILSIYFIRLVTNKINLPVVNQVMEGV